MRAAVGWSCAFVAAIGFSLALATTVARADVDIRISEPASESSVPWRLAVRGTAGRPSAEIWVVVHPTQTFEYWVQPEVTRDAEGNWATQIYIGRAGPIDLGKRFEIVAFADPAVRLWEGLVLGDWPAAEARSQMIEVTRR